MKGAEKDTIQEYFSEIANDKKNETNGRATAANRHAVK